MFFFPILSHFGFIIPQLLRAVRVLFHPWCLDGQQEKFVQVVFQKPQGVQPDV